MLTRLRIRNFKAWKDTGAVRMAPLTVLFGANSAGKSSLGHLLLALKQTASSSDRRRALHTGDDASLVDLGGFVESLHGRDPNVPLEFLLDWRLDAPMRVSNPLVDDETYVGDHLRLSSELVAAPDGQPAVRRLEYALLDGVSEPSQVTLHVTLTQDAQGEVTLRSAPYTLETAPGRTWPLEAPEKFYRLSDRSLARYRNADFLADFALDVERQFAALSHLGPLREAPRRLYGWLGNTPEDVGVRGEYAIACLLAADAEQRVLRRAPGAAAEPFAEFIAHWLEDLGVIERFDVRPTAPGRREYEVRVKTLGGLTDVALPDVGFGVSQVLPALVQAFYCAPGSTVWMEQPEIHLHPEVQAKLADVFISAVHAEENDRARNVQLVIETHSEHFLNRLQRRIAEEAIAPEDVAVYFARPGADGAQLEELVVNEYGDIVNWPHNFFGDEMGELVARTEAASLRRGKGGA